jgi:hypothetical protein
LNANRLCTIRWTLNGNDNLKLIYALRFSILNTEDRLDRPDLFVEEHEDTVVYLDNNCAGSQCYAPCKWFEIGFGKRKKERFE